VGPEQIAQMTFDAIRERGFYVHSHAEMLEPVKERFQAIVEQRNPGDPFAGMSNVRAKLMKALKT
jgi:hypothetical protein